MTSPGSEPQELTRAELGLAAAQEINALRDNVVRLGQHSLALNQVCWALAEALGDVDPLAGDRQVQLVPMDLVRRIVEHRDSLEGKVLGVLAALRAHGTGRDSAGYDLWQDVHLAVLDD